jgi:hypothetical protein
VEQSSVDKGEVMKAKRLKASHFAAALEALGYVHYPVYMPESDVKTLLGHVPGELIDHGFLIGERTFYRTRDVEPLWRKG